MTAEHDEQLEQVLAGMTAWAGPTPRLWQRALKATKNAKSPEASRWAWLFKNRRLSGTIAACVAVVTLGIAIATQLPHQARYGSYVTLGEDMLNEAERTVCSTSTTSPSEKYDTGYAIVDTLSFGGGYAGKTYKGDDVGREYVADGRRGGVGRSRAAIATTASAGDSLIAGSPMAGQESSATESDTPQARQIIRKATIELLTDDVRAAFGKVSMTLNEGLGEFVQESSLTGSGQDAQAEITIRVAADRLSEVMNALRDLGRVQSEQVAGQDVTGQVVDLEARLRNERRVEVELLDLLEKRTDAPLKEILDLRAALGNVRGQIEQLTAQRQRLGQLVSLSTVLVIIRTEKSKPASAEFSILDYFVNGLQTAWRKGLVFLADTTGGLLSILVGGLIWWILLLIAIIAIRRWFRQKA